MVGGCRPGNGAAGSGGFSRATGTGECSRVVGEIRRRARKGGGGERYVRGLPRGVRRALANLSGSRRVGGVRRVFGLPGGKRGRGGERGRWLLVWSVLGGRRLGNGGCSGGFSRDTRFGEHQGGGGAAAGCGCARWVFSYPGVRRRAQRWSGAAGCGTFSRARRWHSPAAGWWSTRG